MGAAYPPGTIGPATRLAGTLAGGYVVVGSTALVLALLDVLTPTTFLIVYTVVAAALWTIALRRGSPSEHGRALRDQFAADPWTIATGIAVVVGIAIVRAVSVPGVGNVLAASPWRYWADGLEVGDVGGIPEASLQWNQFIPPTVSKTFLNSFNAVVGYAAGTEPVPSLNVLTWFGAVALAVALWALGRELGLRLTAALVPLVVSANTIFLNQEIAFDLKTYKAETFGRFAAIAALALGIDAIRRRNASHAVVGGVVLGAAAGTHLIPVVVVSAALGWFAIGRMIVERTIMAIVKPAVLFLAVGALLAGALILATRGDVGFQAIARSNQSDVFPEDFDPTRYFVEHTGEPVAHSATWFDPPGDIIRGFGKAATDAEPAAVSVWLLWITLSAAAAAIAAWFPRSLAHMGIVSFGIALSLVLMMLAFALRYDTVIPARFGPRRLTDYAALPLTLLVLASVERLLQGPARRHTTAVMIGSALLTAILALTFAPRLGIDRERAAVARESLDAVEWIRDHTPCGARILSNRRSAGFMQAAAGRSAVLEGMAPYLRPVILKHVIEITEGARRFFAYPNPNVSYLEDQEVDYVMTVQGPVFGTKGVRPLRTNETALWDAPWIRVVYEDAYAKIGEVALPAAPAARPTGEDAPGYHCRRGPVPMAHRARRGPGRSAPHPQSSTGTTVRIFLSATSASDGIATASTP